MAERHNFFNRWNERPRKPYLKPSLQNPPDITANTQTQNIPLDQTEFTTGEQHSEGTVPVSFLIQEHDEEIKKSRLQQIKDSALEHKYAVALVTTTIGVTGIAGAVWMIGYLKGRKGVEFIEPPIKPTLK